MVFRAMFILWGDKVHKKSEFPDCALSDDAYIAEIGFKHNMNIDVLLMIFFFYFKLFIIKSKMRQKS